MTYSPEIVHQQVEDAQDDDEEGSAELGLEADNDHHAGNEADAGDNHSPDRPFTAEDEANEQEDEEHATSQLEVHLPVLLVERGQAGKCLGLPNPGVREDHDETANDGEITEEKVEVKDEAVAEGLRYDNAHQAGHGVVGMLSNDDEGGTRDHGNHVHDEEQVCQTVRDWGSGLVSEQASDFGKRVAVPSFLLWRYVFR